MEQFDFNKTPKIIFDERLTKNRLSNLTYTGSKKEKSYANRHDLITITFFYYELVEEDEQDKVERFEDFCEVMNKILDECGMLSLNPNNLYEYFIMLCMYTNDPLATFQEVYIQSLKKDE